jgi:hypothetical protein
MRQCARTLRRTRADALTRWGPRYWLMHQPPLGDARTPTARAPDPIARGLHSQLSTGPAYGARVVPSPPGAANCKHQHRKVSAASLPSDPPPLNARTPAPRAHALGRAVSRPIARCVRDRHHHLPRLLRPSALERWGHRLVAHVDVTEPAVIRRNLLCVQSRAPPRGGSPDGNRPDPGPHLTLAGRQPQLPRAKARGRSTRTVSTPPLPTCADHPAPWQRSLQLQPPAPRPASARSRPCLPPASEVQSCRPHPDPSRLTHGIHLDAGRDEGKDAHGMTHTGRTGPCRPPWMPGTGPGCSGATHASATRIACLLFALALAASPGNAEPVVAGAPANGSHDNTAT